MEGISRKDLDRISQILSNYVNTEESISLAKKLTDFDAIPKLYVYTYFNKVYDELKKLNSDDGFDMDEVGQMIDAFEPLDLHFINTNSKTDVNKLFGFLTTGFKRADQFCDFDDSKFHGQTKICRCDNETHFEDIDASSILEEEQMAEFEQIEQDKGWQEAIDKFRNYLNPETLCYPFYFDDENTQKWNDDPTWTCKICSDRMDGSDYDFTVSCDMELNE